MTVAGTDRAEGCPDPKRRALLRAAVAVGATAATGAGLSGCAGGAAGTAAGAPDAPIPPGTSLGPTAEIPVDGGKVFLVPAVVVTQPSAGTFRAFRSRCPHAGCAVTEVEDGAIRCPCHGSEFSIEDGSVRRPPAEDPLTAVAVRVTGDTLTVA